MLEYNELQLIRERVTVAINEIYNLEKDFINLERHATEAYHSCSYDPYCYIVFIEKHLEKLGNIAKAIRLTQVCKQGDSELK